MKLVSSILAVLALCLTVVPAILVLNGTIDSDRNKMLMAVGTVLWFATAPIWFKRKAGGN